MKYIGKEYLPTISNIFILCVLINRLNNEVKKTKKHKYIKKLLVTVNWAKSILCAYPEFNLIGSNINRKI